jgi:hypothetical protein
MLDTLNKNKFLCKPIKKCASYNVIGSAFSQSQAVIETKINTPTIGWLPISASVVGALNFATVQWQGLYANDAIEAIYYFNSFDQNQNVYNGINNYIIVFANLPEVNGFWSITCYNSAGYIVENPYNKYTVGTASNPVKNSSLGYVIYLQYDEPSSDTFPNNNWLPIPQESCYFILRAYLPIDQSYIPPQIINLTPITFAPRS